MLRRLTTLAATGLLCLAATTAPKPAAPAATPAAPGSALTAKAALERLKAMSGTWTGTVSGQPAQPAKTIYHTISGGTAVMETLFPGTDEEMVSVYFLEGDELKMTHYCAAGNQPRMKFDKRASTGSDLVFAFDGGSNFDPKKDMHIHSARLVMKDGGALEESWAYYQDGKEAGRHVLLLTEHIN